nr:meiosis-specific protein ASY1 [Tanacetum cinerariifolium]
TELVVESSKEAKEKVTEGSSERAGEELEQKNTKKQKMGDDKESTELKQCLEIIPKDGDDVTTDATPLSSNKMLKIFDKEDLEVLLRLVKSRFEKIKPMDYMDILLLHNLKTMFEYHVEDNIWKNRQGIVGIKSLLDDLKVTVVKVCVTAAKLNLALLVYASTARVKLVLLVKIEENILDNHKGEQDGIMVDKDDTQDPAEDKQQLNHVREWFKSYHLDDVDVTDALSAFLTSYWRL